MTRFPPGFLQPGGAGATVLGHDCTTLGGNSGSPVISLESRKVVGLPAEQEMETIRLHATAYLLSQGHLNQKLLADRNVTEAAEGFSFGACKTFQVRIRDLEEMTGHAFGARRDADPLDRAEVKEARGLTAKPVLLLNRIEEIAL